MPFQGIQLIKGETAGKGKAAKKSPSPKKGLGSLLVKGPLHSKGPEVALDEHLRAIFPSVGSGPALEEGGEATLLGIQNLQSHLDKQIELLAATPAEEELAEQQGRHGIIGGPIVEIDRDSVHVQDPLQFHYANCPNTFLESRCNFLSARANACVYDGAWMYEANLNTAGVQQIGWATPECIFSNENGVGDAPHSYAFDGKRVKLWNQGASSYGEAWVPGDVIGCGIDLTAGTVSFWRNGKALGVASSNVATGTGRAYYPALSMALRERCRLNFGGSPLSFPVEGYRPLQSPNQAHMRVSSYLADAIVSSFVQFHKPAAAPPKESGGGGGGGSSGGGGGGGGGVSFKSDSGVGGGGGGGGGGSNSEEGAEECGLDNDAPADVEVAEALAGAFNPELLRKLSHGCGDSTSTPNTTSTTSENGGSLFLPPPGRGGSDDVFTSSSSSSSTPEHEQPQVTRPPSFLTERGFIHTSTSTNTNTSTSTSTSTSAVPIISVPRVAGNEAILKLICCSLAFEALLPILTPYVFTATFHRRIIGMIHEKVSPCAAKSLIDTMKAVLPAEAFHTIIRMTLVDSGYFMERNTPWTGCETVLKIARIVLSHRAAVASVACQDEGVVHKIFSGLFTTKLLAVKDAEAAFPKIWWRTAPPSYGDGDTTVQDRCQYFTQAILCSMEALHAITKTMLQDSAPFPAEWVGVPGGKDGIVSHAPIADSPRGLFEWWMAKLVKLNLGLTRQVIPVGTSDHTVLCNVQGALSRVFVDMIAESPEKLGGIEDILAHVDNIGTPHDLPRLGGLHSFLKTEYHKGVAKGAVTPPASAPQWTLPFQLLDWSVILFSLSMVNPLRQLTNAHVEVERAMEQEQMAQARLQSVDPNNAEAVAVLQQGADVSGDRVVSFIRSVTLFEVAYMDKVKAAVFEKWSGSLASIMLKAQKGPHFDFIPEAHITVVLHAYTVIHTESTIFAPAHPLPYFLRSESSKAWLLNYARLVVVLVSDARVVSPDLNVTVIAKIKSLLGVPAYLRFIEQDKDVCRGLLQVLLTCFNDRFWVPSTDILVRFWSGLGFGGHRTFGRVLKKPLGYLESGVMRETFEVMCTDSPDVLSTWVNNMINHLNWTVSEFDQMLEEIRRIGGRADREGDQVFRRCIVTHTLGIHLLRLLEGFASAGQAMLFKPDDPTNLVRVVQLMLHLLNRLTGNDQLIDTVLAMDLMPMQQVRKQAVVDPILGTLFALIGNLPDVGPTLTKANIEANPALKAVMQDGACTAKLLKSLKALAATLDGCPESATSERGMVLHFCATMEVVLEVWKKAEAEEEDEDEDDLCTICYVYPLNATFSPCEHQSCTACIKRHLMNSKKCFFCNAAIDTVVYASAAGEGGGEGDAGNAAEDDAKGDAGGDAGDDGGVSEKEK